MTGTVGRQTGRFAGSHVHLQSRSSLSHGQVSPLSLREPRCRWAQADGALSLPALSSGLCIFVSVEVLRQSVKRMIDSEDTAWIEYYYSWSFACACSAFVLLFLGGLALLLFSLPRMPQNPWESCMDSEPEH